MKKNLLKFINCFSLRVMFLLILLIWWKIKQHCSTVKLKTVCVLQSNKIAITFYNSLSYLYLPVQDKITVNVFSSYQCILPFWLVWSYLVHYFGLTRNSSSLGQDKGLFCTCLMLWNAQYNFRQFRVLWEATPHAVCSKQNQTFSKQKKHCHRVVFLAALCTQDNRNHEFQAPAVQSHSWAAGRPVGSRKLDLILMGPLQLKIFHDFIN